MNLSEQIAYDWLIENGTEPSDIAFRARKTPDFIIAGGKGYEVKRLYGSGIRFSTGQTEKLLEYGNAEVLVVDDERIVGRFEAIALRDRPALVGLFSVSYQEGAVLPTIKVLKRVRQQAAELQALLRARGVDSLPSCLKGLFDDGLTQGAIVEAAFLLLEERLQPKESKDSDAE